MKKTLLVLLLAMILPLSVLAQSSGKIAGVVTDKNSGEPLPGVNVVLEGTSFGAASDEDGYYVILSVPVGTYRITASFIGYGTVALTGVRISANITTEANYQLETTQLELGEAIVIVAERPLIEKNVTQSVSLLTSEEIETIPIRGLQAIAATQNSVVLQDGNLHIRGGRANETGFYLDGASISNVRTGGQALNIIQEAMEEFQVLTGGYTAEFGDANSGIVRADMKTGGDKYSATIDMFTDKFASIGDKFLGTYSYRHHNIITTFGGPLLGNKIRFFGAFENVYRGDNEVRFSEGYEFKDIVNDHVEDPATQGELVDLSYPDGFTPGQEYRRNSFNSTLLFDYSPIRFRLGFAFDNSKAEVGDDPMITTLNDRDMWDKDNTMLLTGKLTHIISPTTLYEARFSFFNEHQWREDDYFGDDWTKWQDSAAVYDHTDGDVVYRKEYSPAYNYKLAGFDMDRNGMVQTPWYNESKTTYYSGGIDFTSQYGKHHEIKAGFSGTMYTIRRFQLSSSVMRELEGLPITDYHDISSSRWSNYLGRSYGYDLYGEEIDSDYEEGDSLRITGPKKPTFYAVYLQDKIEYNDLVINAGLRFDYMDIDDQELVDPENPEINTGTSYMDPSAWKDVDPHMFISPRLGFSFPVSSKTVFYSQYGKFVQKPPLNNIYHGAAEFKDQIGVGGFFYSMPVGYGIDPIKTTSYEIGFRQQLSDFASMEFGGFYKNVIGQVTVERIKPSGGAAIGAYNVLTNGDFATTKGFELKLKMRRTNRIMSQFNYTYTSALGTSSGETSAISAIDRGSQRPNVVNPLDFNQKHRGSVMIDYRFGPKDGGPVFKGLGANMLFTFNSGHSYTFATLDALGQHSDWDMGADYMTDPRSRKADEQIGASTTPWNFNVNLKLNKTFRVMDKMDLTVYLRVVNALNAKNVSNVYSVTGSASDDGMLNHPKGVEVVEKYAAYGDDFTNLYNAINQSNAQAYWWVTGNEIYGNPRQIFFGIKLAY